MKWFRPRATLIRPTDVTAYAAGDEISNHATAGSVVRATINLAGFRSGRIMAAGLDILAASGNVVTTAMDVEMQVYKTADAPAAVGDNVTHPFAGSVRALAVGSFRFDDTGWTGPLGTIAAGTSQEQRVLAHLVQPLATNVLQTPWPNGFPFRFTDDEAKTLTLVLRALAAWTPGAVVQTLGITLDIEADL